MHLPYPIFLSYRAASLVSIRAASRIGPNSWIPRTYNETISGQTTVAARVAAGQRGDAAASLLATVGCRVKAFNTTNLHDRYSHQHCPHQAPPRSVRPGRDAYTASRTRVTHRI